VHKLVTMRFSHYNEKARWALDRFRVPYQEEGYMPGMHAIGALRLVPRHGIGKGDKISTPLAMPIMVTSDGECIRDSSRITRYVSDRFAGKGEGLYPDAEVTALEERFSRKLGPHTRRYAYFHVFTAPHLLQAMADDNVGPTQARWFKRLYPLIQRFVSARLEITAEGAERSLAAARGIIDEVSERISGRRFLVGESFTAADLTFATMAAPLLLPSPEEGYGAVFPAVDACPPEYARLVGELRATPAGQFAMRMFREERGERSLVS